MEGKVIIDIACNNGTSALVTREGELYLFGKDSTFCDSATGIFVRNIHFYVLAANEFLFILGRLLGVKERLVKVGLGKAHGVAITDKGAVYTFGINNKGQCGRDLCSSSLQKQCGTNPQMPSTNLLASSKEPIDDDIESEDSGSATEMKLCAPGEHNWSVDQCMICTQCGQCTVSDDGIMFSFFKLLFNDFRAFNF